MSWPLKRGPAIEFGLVILFLGVSGWAFVHHLGVLRASSHWVATSHETMMAVETVVSTSKDEETGARGFIITGEEKFLEPYHQAQANYPVQMTRLESLLSNDKQQLARFKRLESLIAEKRAWTKDLIERKRTQNPVQAETIIATGEGKVRMDAIRKVVHELQEEAAATLQERHETAQNSYHAAILTVILVDIFGVVLVGALLWLINRELAARTKAESQAHAERQRLQVTLASIGDAVVVVDASNKITFLNRLAEQVTGWSLSETVGEPLSRVFRILKEDTHEKAENPVDKVFREGRIVGLANHTVLITKSGGEVAIEDSAAPIRDEHGEVTGVILVFRDVSERRAVERREQEQKEHSLTAERRKDEFLAMLAHELRNPLAPIANALQLMAIKPQQPGELDWLRATMERQLHHMTRLIDDLLDVSRISRGKFNLNLALTDLTSVIQSALDTSRPIIAHAGHQLTVELPTRPIYVQADHVRLAQVISNLLNNAAKYTERSGQIVLIAATEGKDAVIRVKDTGIGISPLERDRIFDMFVQVDGSVTRAQGGLGIGLTLAKSIVEMHDGIIEVQSGGPGQGSEFIVRLPMAEETKSDEESAADSATKPSNSFESRKILVVDDMRASALVLSRLLSALGQQVQTAHDGPSAIAAIQENSFDVVISDIAMPGMSGYELATELRKLPNTNQIVLVAVTGYGQEEDIRRALDAGFDRHLVKPVGIQELQSLLRSLSTEARDDSDGTRNALQA